MKIFFRNFTNLSIAVLFVFFMSHLSFAAEELSSYQTYPGSACQERINGEIGLYNGSLRNLEENLIDIECPCVNPIQFGTQPVPSLPYITAYGSVKLVDRNYDDNASCKLNAVYRNGSTFSGWFSPRKYTEGSSTTPENLSLGPLSISNTSVSFFYTCKVPAKYNGNPSSVISYKLGLIGVVY